MRIDVTNFETGAVRDAKEIPTRWDLISGLALRRVASECKNNEFNNWSQYSPMELVGFAIDSLYTYISGCRQQPHLLISFRHLMYACHIKENMPPQIAEIREMHNAIGNESTGSNGLQNLSWVALKHIASTCEEGRWKYGEWNWLQGFPFWNTASHALDHMFSITNGAFDEDHWGHALWNLHTSIHFAETRPDLFKLMLSEGYTLTDDIKKHLAELQGKRQQELMERERQVRSGDVVRGSTLRESIQTARGGNPPTERVAFASGDSGSPRRG